MGSLLAPPKMLGTQEARMRKYLLILVLALSIGLVSVSLASAAPGLQGGGKVHYVTFGETLHSIAAYYGVTTDAI